MNEGSYLAHTQGKKHQTNLARRAAQQNKSETLMIKNVPEQVQVKKKVFVKIGRPGEYLFVLRDRLCIGRLACETPWTGRIKWMARYEAVMMRSALALLGRGSRGRNPHRWITLIYRIPDRENKRTRLTTNGTPLHRLPTGNQAGRAAPA